MSEPPIQSPPAQRVACSDCLHFRFFPYGTPWKRKTGCYHPDNMEQKQSEPFLKEQEVPGNHEKINARGDCPQFERKPRRPSLMERLVDTLRS